MKPADVYQQALGFFAEGQLKKAQLCCEFLLKFEPQNTKAMLLLAGIHNQKEDYTLALHYAEKCLSLNFPGSEPHLCKAGSLIGLGRLLEATELCRSLVRDFPSDARPHSLLGISLRRRWLLEEALQATDNAVQRDPTNSDYLNNLGVILQSLGRIPEAIEAYHGAWQNNEANASARMREGMMHLLTGAWSKGWPLYEYRLGPGLGKGLRGLATPLWDGTQDLKGKRLFLYAEQGLGDTLHFVRYTERLTHLGAQVLLEVQAPLRRLMEESQLPGVLQVSALGDPFPQHDFHCPLLSLGKALNLGARETDWAPSHAYLQRPARTKRSGVNLPSKIGLCWSGNPAHANDANRSLPLDALDPLFDMQGLQFHVIQKQQSDSDRGKLATKPQVLNPGKDFSDFTQTADYLLNLDLLISVDTSVAHLGCALGVPTWILLPKVPDWRWGLEGEHCHWYQSARLFRQSNRGDWSEVLARLRAALAGT